MIIVGINYGSTHDSSAALCIDGQIVYAISEERITRRKQDSAFPINAIRACLNYAKIESNQVDQWVFSWPPQPETILFSILVDLRNFKFGSVCGGVLEVIRWLRWKDGVSQLRKNFSFKKHVKFIKVNHHLAHALSVMPYLQKQKSLVFVIDGRGSKESTSIYLKDGMSLRLLKQYNWPNSLGLFYAEVTALCGFKKYSDEWKVMGLAPYGRPQHTFSKLIDKKNNTYFVKGHTILKNKGIKGLLANCPDLVAETDNVQTAFADLACSAQKTYEEILEDLFNYYISKYRVTSVGFAGGCALNCKANGKIIQRFNLEEFFVQPASSDDGTALGAAFYPSFKEKRIHPRAFMPYLGDEYQDAEVEQLLSGLKILYRKSENIFEEVAEYLADGKVVGWFQGRDEFGPRALGNRSILSDPRSENMKQIVNRIVKYRENWRPFAPAILEEYSTEVLRHLKKAPYMIVTDTVTEKYEKLIPAVVHVDKTLRPETVSKDYNSRFWSLINAFYRKTGIPVVMNTSFNLKGEPNVHTPADAIKTFFASGLDVLVIGDIVVRKR